MFFQRKQKGDDGGLQLDKYFKRYVWDDTRTPYLTHVKDLNRTQADYEVLIYSIFVGTFFLIVALTATTNLAPHGQSMPVAFYAFSVVCAAIVFGFTKHYYAAIYCAATPLAAVAYLLAFGFPPSSGPIDYALILGFLLLAFRYSFRISSIGKDYESMPEAPEKPRGRRG